MRYWPLLQNKTTQKSATICHLQFPQSFPKVFWRENHLWTLISSPAQIMMLAQREQRGPEILEQLQRLGVQPQVKLQGLFVRGGCKDLLIDMAAWKKGNSYW